MFPISVRLRCVPRRGSRFLKPPWLSVGLAHPRVKKDGAGPVPPPPASLHRGCFVASAGSWGGARFRVIISGVSRRMPTAESGPLFIPRRSFGVISSPGARVSTGCCEWQRDGAASAGGPSGDAVTPGLARSSQNAYGRHKHGHRAAGGAQGRCGFIVCCFHPCSAPSAFFSVSGLAPKGTARGSAGWPWCSVGTWGGLARHVGVCAYVCRARTPMSLPRKFFFFKASIVAVGA